MAGFRAGSGAGSLRLNLQPKWPFWVTHRNYPQAVGALVTGAADLTGAGTLTCDGTRTVLGAAALTGLGSLTSAGTRTRFGVASLTGLGSSTSAGTHDAIGAAALQGNGTLSTDGTRTRFGFADLTGTGSLTASSTVERTAAADLTGEGSLTATGVSSVSGAADLTGTGSLTAAFKGVGTVPPRIIAAQQRHLKETRAQKHVEGTAALRGLGHMEALGMVVRPASPAAWHGSARLAGTSTLTVAGALVGHVTATAGLRFSQPRTHHGDADLAAVLLLAAAGSAQTVDGSVDLIAFGFLKASGFAASGGITDGQRDAELLALLL